MKIAAIGDIHSQRKRLRRVLAAVQEWDPDLVLLTGDLTKEIRAYKKLHSETVRALESAKSTLRLCLELGVPVLWVPGNHDPADALSALEGNIDRAHHEVLGLRFYGIGGAGPDRFGFPYEWDEAHERRLRFTSPSCDVLLCHSPPHGICDTTHRGHHVGSPALRHLVEHHRGLYVCGHIHEAVGVERLGECLVVNAGSLGAPFGKDHYMQITRTDGAWDAEVVDLDTPISAK